MPLRNQITGESVSEQMRAQRDLQQGIGNSTPSYLQILQALRRQETAIMELRGMVETLSEKDTKDFAAETAKHFDAYVERILAQRLKTYLSPARSEKESGKFPPSGQETADAPEKDRKARTRRHFLHLTSFGALFFLSGTVFLLVLKLCV